MGPDSICFVADDIGDYKYMRGGCSGEVDSIDNSFCGGDLICKLTEEKYWDRRKNGRT